MTGMTITHEQFEAAMRAYTGTYASRELQMAAVNKALQAPPEPPAEMVKLAREIVDGLPDSGLVNWTRQDIDLAALAALQHAAKVVRDAPGRDGIGPRYVSVEHILTALGDTRP